MNWESLLGSESLVLEAAQKLFPEPTAVQCAVIPQALLGHDILARARTGSGKTAAYIIPIIAQILHKSSTNEFSTLVLVPTRELCAQVKAQFDSIGGKYGIVTMQLGQEITTKTTITLLQTSKPAVIIGTPDVVQAITRSPSLMREMGHSILDRVRFFVVDEADIQLGLQHRPEIEVILNGLAQTHQSFLMSATLGQEVEELQSLVLTNPVRIEINDEANQPLEHFYLMVPEEKKHEVFYTMYISKRIGNRLLVFVNSTTRGYAFKLFLERFGIRAAVLNSQLPVASRVHILQDFNKQIIDVIVATDDGDDLAEEFSASRGVDFKSVQTVLNFDIPQTPTSYIHRAGRTARGTSRGMALTFVSPLQSIDEIAALVYEKDHSNILPFDFNIEEAKIFTYRVTSVLQTITRKQIKESRKVDIKREILNSEALKQQLDETSPEVQLLRHDAQLMPKRVSNNLRYIPDYLGRQVKMLQHPLTQKAREESKKSKKQLANLQSLDEAIRQRRKHKNHRKHK